MFPFITLSWNLANMPWRGETLFLCSIFFCEAVIKLFFLTLSSHWQYPGLAIHFLCTHTVFFHQAQFNSPARAGPWHTDEGREAIARSCWLVCFPHLSCMFPLPLHGSFFHWLSSTCGTGLTARSLKWKVILWRVLLLTFSVTCNMAPYTTPSLALRGWGRGSAVAQMGDEENHKPAFLPKPGCLWPMASGNFANVMVIDGLEE